MTKNKDTSNLYQEALLIFSDYNFNLESGGKKICSLSIAIWPYEDEKNLTAYLDITVKRASKRYIYIPVVTRNEIFPDVDGLWLNSDSYASYINKVRSAVYNRLQQLLIRDLEGLTDVIDYFSSVFLYGALTREQYKKCMTSKKI